MARWSVSSPGPVLRAVPALSLFTRLAVGRSVRPDITSWYHLFHSTFSPTLSHPTVCLSP
jgi:hypothetical protein